MIRPQLADLRLRAFKLDRVANEWWHIGPDWYGKALCGFDGDWVKWTSNIGFSTNRESELPSEVCEQCKRVNGEWFMRLDRLIDELAAFYKDGS